MVVNIKKHFSSKETKYKLHDTKTPLSDGVSVCLSRPSEWPLTGNVTSSDQLDLHCSMKDKAAIR